MIVKRSATFVFLVIIILICVLCIVGNHADDEEQSLKGSISDGLEEVSIEAVDDDTSEQSNQDSFLSSTLHRSNHDSKTVILTPSPAISTPASDNSTAIATVYPDIHTGGGNTSSANSTSGNSTTSGRYLRVKVSCSQLYPELENVTNAEEITGTVEIVNMTYLLHGLLITNPTIKTRSTPSNCTIILFYTHWCPWSAKAAPHFNALPRAFRNIRFAAIDSSVHTAINTYFGILSVPSVVLFYNGKILAKFNETIFNVNNFADFITTFTDQKPSIRLNVTSIDFVGPIPSVITKGHDWYLYLSWAFIISCFFYYMSKTSTWHRLLELVQNSWREAEAVATHHHFHQD